MAYTKQTWINGDIITAEKLNNIENGIVGGSSFVVTATDTENEGELVLDKTWNEINAALNSGMFVVIPYDDGELFTQHIIFETGLIDEMYGARAMSGVYFTTDLANGYPKGELNPK